MTWQWFHSPEAYQNLLELPREQLEIIYAEWMAAYKVVSYPDGEQGIVTPEFENFAFFQHNATVQFHETRYDRALKAAKQLDLEDLISTIWDYTSQLSECDNGGFNAYICPFHCHSVSFSATKLFN